MVVILKENRQENKIERETKNKMANSLPTLRLLLSISFFLLFFPVVDLSGPHLPRQRLRPNDRGHHLYCSAFHSQFTPLTHVHNPFVYLGWFLSHAPVVLWPSWDLSSSCFSVPFFVHMARTVHCRYGHAKLRHIHQNSDNQRTSYTSRQVKTGQGGFKQVMSGQDGEGKAVTFTHTGNCGFFLFLFFSFSILYFVVSILCFLCSLFFWPVARVRLTINGSDKRDVKAGSTRSRSFPRVDGPPVVFFP